MSPPRKLVGAFTRLEAQAAAASVIAEQGQEHDVYPTRMRCDEQGAFFTPRARPGGPAGNAHIPASGFTCLEARRRVHCQPHPGESTPHP